MGWLEHFFNSAERMDKIKLEELLQLMQRIKFLNLKLAEAHKIMLKIQTARYAGSQVPQAVRDEIRKKIEAIKKNLQEDIVLAADILRRETKQ